MFILVAFSTLGIRLAYKIFRITDSLSAGMQKATLNYADASEYANAVVKKLTELRSEAQFEAFYVDALAECEKLGKSPQTVDTDLQQLILVH